ncbi:hypothetical protein AKJ38_02605 [candidate division MSBL1 archaeon SCGC-AAA259I14]|uniref:DUF1616 domain-containing protein n=1 Tax=candidate division MSBL1 archaeon SCGC-AAA259I14 TaxID=1698268 RepID=A0A133URF3_9EURY|nr:hypothetical protein AKJ38_02605 [candidate division MSBL1 archaeon SCGC-AAA259I14]
MRRVLNPFKLQDWPYKLFLLVVLSLTLLSFLLTHLRQYFINLPVLEELVGFVFLTFVPGFLILRILRIHELPTYKSLIYSVGLSLSSLFLVALGINFVYPHLGYKNPLNTFSLSVSLLIFILVLSILSYFRDKDVNFDGAEIDESIFRDSREILFLLIIPFLAIIGTYIAFFHGNNMLLLLIYIIISAFPFLVIFQKKRECIKRILVT